MTHSRDSEIKLGLLSCALTLNLYVSLYAIIMLVILKLTFTDHCVPD